MQAQPSKNGAPKGGTAKGWGPKVGPRRVGGPKFRSFFSLSRHHSALSVSLLWVSLLVELAMTYLGPVLLRPSPT